MTKRFYSRLFVVLLWIVLSLGIYQCSVQDIEQQPQQYTEEQGQPVPLMMDDKIRVLIKTGNYEFPRKPVDWSKYQNPTRFWDREEKTLFQIKVGFFIMWLRQCPLSGIVSVNIEYNNGIQEKTIKE